MLVQNGSIIIPASQPPASPVSLAPEVELPLPVSLAPEVELSEPSPPPKSRSFTRSGRGKGGELAGKLKASKDVTAPATKRKNLVEPEIESPPSMINPSSKSADPKPSRKRIKIANVKFSSVSLTTVTDRLESQLKRSTPTPSQASIQNEKISTPTPPRPVRPVSRPTKSRTVAQPPPSHSPVTGQS